ncbi:MAG: polysaccharide biosynthesis tyrosine autokinase [Geminicoccaceae bacterium]
MNSVTRVRKNAIERPAASPPREVEYDLGDIFKVLRRRRGVIITTVLVLTTCAGLIALNLTPSYTAYSTIVVEPRVTHIISFDETQRDVPADTSTINTHVKFLTSNSFAHGVIERLDLVQNPEFNSAIRKKENAPDELHPVLSEALSWAQIPLVAIGLAKQPSSGAQDPLRSGDGSNTEESAPVTAQVDASEPRVAIPEANHSPASGAVVRSAPVVSESEARGGATSAQDDKHGSPAVAEDGARDALMELVTEAFLGQVEVGPSGLPLVAVGLANQPSSGAQDPLSSGDHSNPEEVAPGTAQVKPSEPRVAIPEANHSPAGSAVDPSARLVRGAPAMAGATTAQDDKHGSPAVTEDRAHDALLEEVTEAFLKQLEVGPSGQSYAISVAFTSVDPETAARVANTMADLYVEHQLESKQTATTGALDWLAHRLDELREQLVQSERAAEEYRVENELAVSGDGLGFSDEELAALTQELIRAQAERVATQAKLDRIRQLRSSGQNLESVPEVMMSPIIADLRQQEMEILRTEAQLRQEYGPRHPAIIQVQADKDKFAARVDAEIHNIIAGLANQVATIQVREQTLQVSLARAQSASTDKSRAEIQLRLLEGEVASTRTLYTMLLDRFKELTAQHELLEPGVRVISAAAVPVKPSAPQVKLITGAGFMGSLMLGTLLAFVVDRLDRGLRTGRQAEEVLKLPHIGLIPKLGGDVRGQGAHRYLAEKPTSAYAEAIRGVQTALCFSNVDRPPQVVLVTSSVPAEGKTTLALSLATLLAQSGCKTVAVDLDLRRPNLGHPSREAGGGDLVDYMRGEKALHEILHEVDEVYNLHIVPARRLTASPTDLLASQRMASLMAELRARYDYVVLDSPPVLGMADSRFAARLADAVVFVVRWSTTGEEVALKALDILRDSGAPIAGTVLTQVDVRRHRKYSPEDVLHYYGQYRRYYVN